MDRSDFVDRKQIINHKEPSAAKPQPNFGLSPDAKAAKRKKYLFELSVLGALAGGISESEMFRILENLPKPRNFSSIVVHVTKVLARGRFETHPSRKTSERSERQALEKILCRSVKPAEKGRKLCDRVTRDCREDRSMWRGTTRTGSKFATG